MFDLIFPKHWSTLKKLIWLKAAALSSAVVKTVTAAIVHIRDALAGPAQNVTIAIEPVQDLHGYGSPWPAGGGVNLFPDVLPSSAVAGRIETSGVIGAATNARVFGIPCKQNTDYCFSQATTGVAATVGFGTKLPAVGDSGVYSGNMTNRTSWTLNSGENTFIWFTISNSADYSTLVGNQMQIEEGSTKTTYSPYSNICPISGWTGASVTRTGANIWGGEKMADDVVNAVNNSARSDKGENSNGKYFSLTASNEICVRFFSMPFKEKTQYSFIFKCAKSNNRYALNFSVKYTDGTTQTLIIPGVDDRSVVPDQVYTFAISTLPNRTVEYFAGYYNSGTTYFYYDSCGLFEGVLTADQFQPYTGTTIPITFPTPPGTVYGGTLDVTNGVLTVTHVSETFTGADIVSGDSDFSAARKYAAVRRAYASKTAGYRVSNSYKALLSTDTDTTGFLFVSNTNLRVRVFDPRFTDLASAQAVLNATPFQVCYELAEPLVYQLTAHQIDLLLGENSLWSDTGSTTLTYLADGRASDTEALGILLAGRYHNSGAADEATDAEALDILLGGTK